MQRELSSGAIVFGRVSALIIVCAFMPFIVATLAALGLAVFDFLTPGPVHQTLASLVGWDGGRWGLYMLYGLIPGLPVTGYIVVIGVAHIGDDL